MTHLRSERHALAFAGTPRHRPRVWRGGAAAFAIVLAWPAAAHASDPYRLEVGDVLEITVAGMPDLHQRVPVQLDGTISYPHIQHLAVAGTTLDETRRAIQAAVSSQLLKQRLPDGREIMVGIEPDDVSAAVAEYRPVYVSGDVTRPGEQPYRPLMTVRQAVSVAGGFDVFRASGRAPTSEIADAQGEQVSTATELAKEAANVARLRHELGDRPAAAAPTASAVALPPVVLDGLRRSQAELSATDQADFDRERDFLKRSLDKLNDQAGVLTRQQNDEDQGVKIDAEDVEKLAGLFKTGAVTGQRVNDARRAMLLSSTRSLQATAQVMQISRQKDEVSRQLERLDDLRRIKLLAELSDRLARTHQLEARLAALDRKLLGLNARPAEGLDAPREPDVHVIRKAGTGGTQRFPAEIDAELQPGDVIEVTMRARTPLAAAAP